MLVAYLDWIACSSSQKILATWNFAIVNIKVFAILGWQVPSFSFHYVNTSRILSAHLQLTLWLARASVFMLDGHQ